MGVKLFGDWKLARALGKNLNREIEEASLTARQKIGLYIEGQVKRHLRDQDLGWEPLNPKTLANKVRKGSSNKILIDTSTYFQSITTNTIGRVVFVGVKRNVTDREGNNLADVGTVHEFGTRSGDIPARPLWRPVLKEAIKFANERNILLNELADRLRKYTK